MSSNYERDFHDWTQRQAALIRAGRFEGLDLEHIAEELESMGRSERRELESRLEVLAMHLLKWRFQPQGRGRSWRDIIRVQRLRVQRVLADNPSLQPRAAGLLEQVYGAARIGAARIGAARIGAAGETGLDEGLFPEQCPFVLEQVLDEGFWPD